MSNPKCPSCQRSNTSIVEGQLAICKSCSKTKRCVFHFCWACQREWPRNASPTGSCTLPNCALRAALLSDKIISDQSTLVRGCPYFRACPECKALLTHSKVGCPIITCPNCKTSFCFRCLSQNCLGIMVTEARWSLIRGLSAFQENNISPCRMVDNKQCLAGLGL